MVLPAVHALHEKGFTIDWVCGSTVRPLLECYRWINVIPADDKAIFFGKPIQRIQSIARLWRSVLPQRYDLCATLYYDRRFGLLALPIRARRKVSLSRRSRASALL